MHWWWVVILRLHGKPVRADTTAEQTRKTVADGLTFYARLYRVLAIVVLALLGCMGALAEGHGSAAYFVVAVSSFAFLWAATGLGFRGAQALREGRPCARAMLVVFVVLLTWFLIGCVSLSSASFYHLPLWLNMLVTSLLVLLGIGSYCLEIVYLVSAGDPAVGHRSEIHT